MRLWRFGKFEFFADHWTQRPVFQAGDKRGVNTREFFRRGVWQRHPANIAVALHRIARINFHTPTAADHRYPPVLRENDKIFPEIHISEQFDDHVHAAP